MPIYRVDERVFDLFPHFHRGVVIATAVNNNDDGSADLRQQLVEAAQKVAGSATQEETPRIEVWNDAYSRFGVDPKKYTPSIRFLYEQIRRGKPPRSISKIVDIMNIASIRWTIPCGGDDLSTIVPGDLHLGFASGDESFAPLFKPHAIEHPVPGEIIYYTPQSNRVMCRRWTWRNADFSKLTAATRAVAVNIDLMIPPLDQGDLEVAVSEVADNLRIYCGAQTAVYHLWRQTPCFTFEVR